MSDFTCRQERVVSDEAIVRSAWDAYQAAFATAAVRCIQEQVCYTLDTIRQALADPDYLKFILLDEQTVIGICLATNSLEKARVAYVNPERLRRDYPQETADGKLYYFTAICVRPEHQRSHAALPMFVELAKWFVAEKPLMAFDFSVEKNSFLPTLLQSMAKLCLPSLTGKEPEPEYTKLGGQEYGILRIP